MKLLVLKEKHEDEHWLIEDNEDLYRVALIIVKRRFEEGYWYGINANENHDDDLAEATRIVETEDGKAAWRLLQMRKNHEYEGYIDYDLHSSRGFKTNVKFRSDLLFTWKHAQTIRLAAEANAVLDRPGQIEAMAASMDLEPDEVERFLEENERHWELIKDSMAG